MKSDYSGIGNNNNNNNNDITAEDDEWERQMTFMLPFAKGLPAVSDFVASTRLHFRFPTWGLREAPGARGEVGVFCTEVPFVFIQPAFRKQFLTISDSPPTSHFPTDLIPPTETVNNPPSRNTTSAQIMFQINNGPSLKAEI